MKVVLVGGVGYLGANAVALHATLGDDVVVVSRESSVAKRPRIAGFIMEHSKLIVARDVSSSRFINEFIASTGCPDIAYILLGRLKGGKRGLYMANAVIPDLWAHAFANRCGGATRIVYTSSVLAVGDPGACSSGGVVVEEDSHLAGCKPLSVVGRSKAEGERRILRACSLGARVLVARLGLVVGWAAYHAEWRRLVQLAKLGAVLGLRLRVHATPAKSFFEFVRWVEEESKLSDCLWAYLTPLRVSIEHVSAMMAKSLRGRALLRIPTPRWLVSTLLPRELVVQDSFRFTSRYSVVRGFRWASIGEALEDVVEWCREGCKP